MFTSPLYWIADASLAGGRPLVDLAQEAIAAGLQVYQYREKTLSHKDQYPIALALADLARATGTTFVVNDGIDLALVVKAHGVHLGQEDFPVKDARRILGTKMLIGCSAHTFDQAKAAEADGADYLGVGPIYESTTKMARAPLGCEKLREICEAVRIPVYAIGGVTVERCREVLAAGAKGVAVASGLLQPSIGKQTKAFLRALAAAPHRAQKVD
ncbi:MAG: thiamine phosphate synthase [Nitrospirota bacterium]